jgi:hypothetical protein
MWCVAGTHSSLVRWAGSLEFRPGAGRSPGRRSPGSPPYAHRSGRFRPPAYVVSRQTSTSRRRCARRPPARLRVLKLGRSPDAGVGGKGELADQQQAAAGVGERAGSSGRRRRKTPGSGAGGRRAWRPVPAVAGLHRRPGPAARGRWRRRPRRRRSTLASVTRWIRASMVFGEAMAGDGTRQHVRDARVDASQPQACGATTLEIAAMSRYRL